MIATCPRCGEENDYQGELDNVAYAECARCLYLFSFTPVMQLTIGGDPPSQGHVVAGPSDGAGDGGSGLELSPLARDRTAVVEADVTSERTETRKRQLGFEYDDGKPPYRIPLMAEIHAGPLNGLRHVSTFSGCGGSSLGFRMAGFKTLASVEFVRAAQDTYAANFPETPIVCGDVRNLEPAVMMERLGLERGELDVLEGSPPCASFSTAGIRTDGWGIVKSYSDTKQRTDDLFDEYVRLIAGFRPRVFVAENVAGFLMGAADSYRQWVEDAMADLGYVVWHDLLDAARFGVPQRRKRVIIVGVRRDVGTHPADMYPKPLPYTYSVRDALPWLDSVHESGHGYLPDTTDSSDRPMKTVRAGAYSLTVRDTPEHLIVSNRLTSYHADCIERPLDEPIATIMADGIGGDTMGDWLVVPPSVPDADYEGSIEGYAIHAEWLRLHEGETSDRYLSLIRAQSDKPSPTVTATAGQKGAAGVTHPSEPRKFTIPELRRLCGFPDDFVLTGRYMQQWERLGRAVPPPLMAAVASKIAEKLCAA